MTITHPAADPVARHVADLERVLRGPARVRRSMIREVRDGLHDAVEAYRACGVDHDRAAAKAVADFGPVGEIAPQLQEELAARQGRQAALLVALIFPAMTLAWDLLLMSGVAWKQHAAPHLTIALARILDTGSMVFAAVAFALLVASFLRTVPPRRFTALVGVTAWAGALFCATASMAMNLTDVAATADMLLTNAYALPAFGVSLLAFGVVIGTGVRTLRVARAC